MSDGNRVATWHEMDELATRALKARFEASEGWEELWISALDTIDSYLFPWGERPEPLQENFGQVSAILSYTVQMLRDERIGAKAHFWNPASNRPPKAFEDWSRLSAVIVLVAACRERERRAGSGRDVFETAQAELRSKGMVVERARLRSIVSNASRMPASHLELARYTQSLFEQQGNEPQPFIDIYVNILARDMTPL